MADNNQTAPPPAPPVPPVPREGFARPYMGCGYIPQVDQLSRIRRIRDIELQQSRRLRINFRNYQDGYDDCYYDHYNGGPPRQMPLPPPPPPPPPPPHNCDGYDPLCAPPPYCGYLPCNYFSDENPNGCTIM